MKCKKESDLMNTDSSLVRKNQLYLKNLFYHYKKYFMFISNMSNMNTEPQTILFTTAQILKIVNFAFKTIINRSKNSNKNIDIATLKTMYDGFYTGYVSLMENLDFPIPKKIDLVSKKQMLDDYFRKNITYSKYNMTKVHKSVANRITTQNLKNRANQFLENKARITTNDKSLLLKKRVAETNY